MLSNKLAFTALGAACIVAASAGGYLAVRQNATSAATTQAESVNSAQATQPAAASDPVAETEAVVERALPAERPVVAPAPVKPATPTAAAPKPVTKAAPAQTVRTDTPAQEDRNWPSGTTSAPVPAPLPAQVAQTTPEPVAPQLRPG